MPWRMNTGTSCSKISWAINKRIWFSQLSLELDSKGLFCSLQSYMFLGHVCGCLISISTRLKDYPVSDSPVRQANQALADTILDQHVLKKTALFFWDTAEPVCAGSHLFITRGVWGRWRMFWKYRSAVMTAGITTFNASAFSQHIYCGSDGARGWIIW